jgi:hypothetical protein
MRALLARSFGVALLAVLTACAPRRPADAPVPDAPIRLLAVLPLEAVPAASPAPGTEAPPPLPADAPAAVTAQIYAVLAEQSYFRFVPDLTVADALGRPSLDGAATRAERAAKLGRAAAADAVLAGEVSRFRERVGRDYGATAAAAVSFRLELIEVSTGRVLWSAAFDKAQEPLTSNLLDWWMFWRGGPRWLSARELARFGVEQLLDDMRAAVR